jgi:hypothetical protein
MADHPERRRSPFTRVEMPKMWTYSDGALTIKGYWWPGGTASAGSWVLVDPVTGNVQGVVAPGEFSRATAEQRASFEAFVAQRGLNARSLAVGLAPGTPRAL